MAIELKARLTVQTGGAVLLTDAGADLLEQIDVSGSLSEAARRLRFSYRRAWLLLDEMNRRSAKPLVQTAIGGKKGGGAQLTPAGHATLRAYRQLQVRLQTLLLRSTRAFDRAMRLE